MVFYMQTYIYYLGFLYIYTLRPLLSVVIVAAAVIHGVGTADISPSTDGLEMRLVLQIK